MKTLVLLYLLWAAFHDVRSWQIPNKGYIFMFFLGFGIFALKGATGLVFYLFQSFLPIFFLFPLFLIRMLGAGDIKLYSILCGWLGVPCFFTCFIYSILTGSFLSVLKLFRRRMRPFKTHQGIPFSIPILISLILDLTYESREVLQWIKG